MRLALNLARNFRWKNPLECCLLAEFGPLAGTATAVSRLVRNDPEDSEVAVDSSGCEVAGGSARAPWSATRVLMARW